jgi:hypothetical protein
MVRELTADEVEFELTVEPEDIPVRGNAMASGDDELDKACEGEILDRLDRGDVWAWAYVKVIAKWNGFSGWAGLGGCCYEDERHFVENSMYYEDLKHEALADLNRVIAEHARKLQPLMV